MNDRFRFRAWNDKVGFIYFGPDYCNGCEWWDFPDAVKDKSWVVEQCTGLKDKNGNLIYEGDIVESTIATRNNKPARDVIKYNNEFAGFEPMCLYDCDCGIYNPGDELIIVGNIHENPKLLEDK